MSRPPTRRSSREANRGRGAPRVPRGAPSAGGWGGPCRGPPRGGDRLSGPAVAIIGGSGLYELEGLTDVRWKRVRTPFGDPSDELCVGRYDGRPVIFLARHGRGHRIMPTELNFRAN